jgi:hypothetical protein
MGRRSSPSPPVTRCAPSSSASGPPPRRIHRRPASEVDVLHAAREGSWSGWRRRCRASPRDN